MLQANAFLAECRAGATGVLRGAGPVGASGVAEALRRFLAAGHVRLAGVVGNGILGQPAVGGSGGATVARASAAAVEQVLHGKVDVDALALARDLDPVRQRAQGPVRPAAAAVPDTVSE